MTPFFEADVIRTTISEQILEKLGLDRKSHRVSYGVVSEVGRPPEKCSLFLVESEPVMLDQSPPSTFSCGRGANPGETAVRPYREGNGDSFVSRYGPGRVIIVSSLDQADSRQAITMHVVGVEGRSVRRKGFERIAVWDPKVSRFVEKREGFESTAEDPVILIPNFRDDTIYAIRFTQLSSYQSSPLANGVSQFFV